MKTLIVNVDVRLESVREARRITKDDMRGAILSFVTYAHNFNLAYTTQIDLMGGDGAIHRA